MNRCGGKIPSENFRKKLELEKCLNQRDTPQISETKSNQIMLQLETKTCFEQFLFGEFFLELFDK